MVVQPRRRIIGPLSCPAGELNRPVQQPVHLAPFARHSTAAGLLCRRDGMLPRERRTVPLRSLGEADHRPDPSPHPLLVAAHRNHLGHQVDVPGFGRPLQCVGEQPVRLVVLLSGRMQPSRVLGPLAGHVDQPRTQVTTGLHDEAAHHLKLRGNGRDHRADADGILQSPLPGQHGGEDVHGSWVNTARVVGHMQQPIFVVRRQFAIRGDLDQSHQPATGAEGVIEPLRRGRRGYPAAHFEVVNLAAG